MDIETFQNLPTSELTQIVKTAGPRVCAFPTDGTTRWFMLEHPTEFQKKQADTYFNIMVPAHLNIFRLFFEYGIEIILEPMLGIGLLDREPAYVETLPDGFARLIRHPDFMNLCHEYQVQVRFYGDYHRVLAGTPYAAQSKIFDEYSQILAEQTGKYQKHRLLIGIYPDETVESVASFAVQHYQKYGRIPDQKEIITAYYGEYLPQLDIFIGSDKPSVFGLPLIAIDRMALYFTISPSLYFTERQLRNILYDYIYVRKASRENYVQMKSEDWELMRNFYQVNREGVLGVGWKSTTGSVWYPLPQVFWPSETIKYPPNHCPHSREESNGNN